MAGIPQFAVSPENTGLPAISGTPTVGETLWCTSGAWTGDPQPIITYQWLDDDRPIANATANTYALQSTDSGNMVACQVTAANGAGRDSVVSSALHIETTQGPQGSGGRDGNSNSSLGDDSVSNGSSNNGSVSLGSIPGEANTFTVDRIETVRAHRSVRVTLALPGLGTLQIIGKTSIMSMHRHKTLRVAHRRLTVKKAGSIRVLLPLSGQAKKLLAKQGVLKVMLTITYTPTGGTTKSANREVTFWLTHRR